MADFSRRAVIKATGAVGAAMLPVGLASDESAAQEQRHVAAADGGPAAAAARPQAQPTTYLFFNAEEAAFIEAAVAQSRLV